MAYQGVSGPGHCPSITTDHAYFDHAYLDHAYLDQAYFDHAYFDHAYLDQAYFDQAYFCHCRSTSTGNTVLPVPSLVEEVVAAGDGVVVERGRDVELAGAFRVGGGRRPAYARCP